MIDKGAESETDEVPLSDSTICRRVDDMSHDAEDALSEIIKSLNISSQVDE
jgi:hypothetical protein